jgi:hypothetical protein
MVKRDLADAQSDISADWQLGIAYNAALKLCTIVLHASGCRPEKTSQHYRTIRALPLILPAREADADYLDTCRIKRNAVEYDYVGGATHEDARELVEFARQLRDDVMEWLRHEHPHLLPREEQL